MRKNGYLILENGEVHRGESFGFENEASGEVVFTTGMMGYPESYTDPSYQGQILIQTYPLIGNYGVPSSAKHNSLEDYFESGKIQIKGLLVSSYIENNSHWQSKENLSSWLIREKIPALSGLDTRTLTKSIRETGVMKGIISFTKSRYQAGLNFVDINKSNLVELVSCRKLTTYGNGKLKILLLDCGLKYNQIRILLSLGLQVERIPWNFDPYQNNLKFDMLMVSNGPGDPKMLTKTIATIKETLKRKIPTLGICLGNQILALACGADTYKLKFGHRGQNQPVKDEFSGKLYITTQNHGFAVDAKTLPVGWKAWFTNLNDNTNEGIRHEYLPYFSTQFHPESAPGPTDTEWIFKFFLERAKKWLKIT